MFGLMKKKIGRPPRQNGVKTVYKQLAVRPETHAKITEIADSNNKSIIDTVSELVGA